MLARRAAAAADFVTCVTCSYKTLVIRVFLWGFLWFKKLENGSDSGNTCHPSGARPGPVWERGGEPRGRGGGGEHPAADGPRRPDPQPAVQTPAGPHQGSDEDRPRRVPRQPGVCVHYR